MGVDFSFSGGRLSGTKLMLICKIHMIWLLDRQLPAVSGYYRVYLLMLVKQEIKVLRLVCPR